MLTITKSQFENFDKVYRLNLINSITGFKPANLIGTSNKEGISNVAIFSSVVHLGSAPALLGFILRPTTVPRNTYQNIKDTGEYTINHVSIGKTAPAHLTSAKFEESEFERVGLHEHWIENFKAPFVKESPVKIGLKFEEEIDIKLNGTKMIIGSIQCIELSSNLLLKNGSLDLEASGTASISGLDSYYSAKKIATYPYARPHFTLEDLLK